jgi:hypothetical protein
MNWTSLKASACVRLFALALIFSTVACQPIKTIPIVEIDMRVTAGVCEAWQPVTYSSRDTEQTQIEVRAGNAAREAYCRGID